MIALLGGTFDPIHFGHLRPALDILQTLDAAEVRVIPCRIPPHRPPPLATPAQRLAMVRAAVANEPRLVVDERELRRDGPSYMVDTLHSLRAEHGAAAPLALILGMDSFLSLPAWHRWREIPELCHLIVARRPGWMPPIDGEMGEQVAMRHVDDPAALRTLPAGKLFLCPVTQMDISASRIRALVAAGHSPRYLLPDAVLEYIEHHNLYRDQS